MDEYINATDKKGNIRAQFRVDPTIRIDDLFEVTYLESSLKSQIKKVIYHEPATIVIWGDGTKTVSKCNPNDTYNPEAGFAICVAKQYFGETGYHKALNKSVIVTQKEWDEYRKAYENELNYWGGGNSETPTKTISLSRVNHLDIEDKLAIVNGERVKSIKSLIKNKEKKEAKKA